MAKKPESKLHTSASEASPADQRAAGMGGSYSIDPAGAVTLAHRTEPANASRKAPLTDTKGNLVQPAAGATDEAAG
jgi:hypothetical protein